MKTAGKKRCAYCARLRTDIVSTTEKLFDKDLGTVLTHILGIKNLQPGTFKQTTVCTECATSVIAAEHIAVKTRDIYLKTQKSKRKPNAGDTTTQLDGLQTLFDNSDDNLPNGRQTPAPPKKITQRRKSTAAAGGVGVNEAAEKKKPKTTAKKTNSTKITPAAATATANANGISSTDNKDTTDDDKLDMANDAAEFPVTVPKKVTQRDKAKKETPKKAKTPSAKQATKKTPAKGLPAASTLKADAKEIITLEEPVVASPVKVLQQTASPTKRKLFNKFADEDEDYANDKVGKASPQKILQPTASPNKHKLFTKFTDDDDDCAKANDQVGKSSPLKVVQQSVSPNKHKLFNKFGDDDDDDDYAKTNDKAVKDSPQKVFQQNASIVKRKSFNKFTDEVDDYANGNESQPMHSTAKKARQESGNFSQDYSQNEDDADGDNITRVCNNCGKVYYNEERYTAHVDSRKCAEAAHECQQCGRRFLKLKKLHQHIRSKHDKKTSGDDEDDEC